MIAGDPPEGVKSEKPTGAYYPNLVITALEHKGEVNLKGEEQTSDPDTTRGEKRDPPF